MTHYFPEIMALNPIINEKTKKTDKPNNFKKNSENLSLGLNPYKINFCFFIFGIFTNRSKSASNIYFFFKKQLFQGLLLE